MVEHGGDNTHKHIRVAPKRHSCRLKVIDPKLHYTQQVLCNHSYLAVPIKVCKLGNEVR